MPEPKLDFLKQKYNLHNAPEVNSAADRTQTRIGERVPQNPSSRIQNYLDRFNEIIDRTDPDKRNRGIQAFKQVLHDKTVIGPGNIPESTFLLEQRIARQQGHGNIEITDEFKEQKTTQIINNQTQSLDRWVDYLSSSDAQYPDWTKYWTLRSVTEMGRLEKTVDSQGKETARFTKRTKDTTALFPPLNPRALAMTISALRDKIADDRNSKQDQILIENRSIRLSDEDFSTLMQTESFAKIYGQFLIEMPEYSIEGLRETRGKWIKYLQGSDPKDLVASLEGYPLEWCTAAYDTAQSQLQLGDFHVYYSISEAGDPVIPRLAIRMQGDQIAEDPRGIAPDQNLDPYIGDVLEKKLKEFGTEGEAYKKKSANVKLLTKVEDKVQNGQALTKDDLVFLYEINGIIEGFGYQKDPRVDELRSGRNLNEDMLVVFDCNKHQIARTQSEINTNTKAYVGPLEDGIFDMLPSTLEYIYTHFPEERIRRFELEIGGKSAKDIQKELVSGDLHVSDYAAEILENRDFTTSEKSETIELVRISLPELGFTNRVSIEAVYGRARELGLELIPAEVGLHLRLNYKDQPMGESLHIGMKQISHHGSPTILTVERRGPDALSNGIWTSAGTQHLTDEFIFGLHRNT